MNWWKPAPVKSSYEPLVLSADNPLKQRLDVFLEKMKNTYPNKPIPDIYLITDHAKFDAAYGHNLGKYQASIIPMQNNASHMFITKDYYDLLTPKELLAVMGHEYGHHFANHMEKKAAAQFRPPVAFASASRALECEADHFSAYYFPEAKDHFVPAIAKIRAAISQPMVSQTNELDQHPADTIRMKGARFEEALKIKPGHVSFDAGCNALLPALPVNTPKVTPDQQPTPGPHSKSKRHHTNRLAD